MSRSGPIQSACDSDACPDCGNEKLRRRFDTLWCVRCGNVYERDGKDDPKGTERAFKERIFLGSGDSSAERSSLLHRRLDEALVYLSGIQQVPMPTESPESSAAYRKQVVASEEVIKIILQDIAVAILGHEVVPKKRYTDLREDLEEFVRINRPSYPAPKPGEEGDESYGTRVFLLDELQEILDGEWSNDE